MDDTPDDAFAQVNSKGYSISYQADHRAVVNIGVNFDSTTRTIGGWKIVSAPTSNKKSPLLITNLFLFLSYYCIFELINFTKPNKK